MEDKCVGSWYSVGLLLPVLLGAQQEARKSNMDLVGYNDLQARSAYQPVIQKQGERWIAYIGHHGGEQLNPLTGKMEPNGTSIVDVTDPKHPKYLVHIPGEPKERTGEFGGASMVRVCSGNDLPHGDKGKFYMLRDFGNSAHEIWDVTDPAQAQPHDRDRQRPARHAQELVGMRHRHRLSGFRPGGLAHAAHDADLRSERSGEARVHPQLRLAGTAAGRAKAPRRAACTGLFRPGRKAIAFTSLTATRATA